MSEATYNDRVFINCAFDTDYLPILRAIVFCIYRCGFVPITALNEDNALDNRLQKIERCIEQCKYGIHDISRTQLNENNLPRFNMPFELGLFFGAKHFGNKIQKSKSALIFDSERYRYQQFISDLNGVDIKDHANNPNIAMQKVRNWLEISSRRSSIPGHIFIQRQYQTFTSGLPTVVENLGLDFNNIPFSTFCVIVEESIREIES